MSLFGKNKKIYSSASINEDMLVLTSRTRFNASHSETRIMIDKISSVTHSVVLGKRSAVLGVLGALSMFGGLLLMFMNASALMAAIPLAVIGAVFILLAVLLREHSIMVSCSGDCFDVCVGKKNIDDFYARICTVLKMHKEGHRIADTVLTPDA